jgi:hypothetical protein
MASDQETIRIARLVLGDVGGAVVDGTTQPVGGGGAVSLGVVPATSRS